MTLKKVDTIYFRKLDKAEKLAIQKLIQHFNEATAMGAAKRALFGFLDLFKKMRH